MSWLTNLLTHESIAHTILIYSFVIATGVFLGKIKFKGISLGVTFVLFMGLLIGHFSNALNPESGLAINHETLHFLKEFGLILFIYTIGLQVGPGFFSSFKKGGVTLNILAMGVVFLGITITIIGYYALGGNTSLPMMVGIMSGAVTNTPGLGAAEEALRQVGYEGDPIGLGYAVAYPLGVLGVLLSLALARVICRVKLDKESTALQSEASETDGPIKMSVVVNNEALEGKKLSECRELIGRELIVSRIMTTEDELIIPASTTELHLGYKLLIVTAAHNKEAILTFIGKSVNVKWPEDEATLVSRRIVITNDKINGKTIGSLRLRNSYGLNVTRVNRAGIDLLATEDLALQVGDAVTLVGPLATIQRVEGMLGNVLKRLNDPHLASIFFGILVGMVVGSIPIMFPGMPTPAKLGLAGGPLIVSILVGRFGYKIGLITYTTRSANLMLREIGICLFLASVGLSSGDKFVETVISSNGPVWIAMGFLITFIPTFVIALIARFGCKLNYFSIMGLIAGSTTNPPILAYSSNIADNDAPAIAYSTVYPLTMFMRIICAQMIILVMM